MIEQHQVVARATQPSRAPTNESTAPRRRPGRPPAPACNSRAREAALYTSWLAESHLQAGEIDRAGAAATRALELADRVNSARSDERLAYLHHALGPHRDISSVRAFDERYRSDRSPSD